MTNSISEVKPNQCFGCSACFAICTQNAIEMKPDSEGFMAPIMDMDKCINCGACKKVCPAINRWTPEAAMNRYYFFQNPDKSVLKNSTSGGAFSAVVETVNNPYVCGCVEDDNFYIKHIVAKEEKDIAKMRGSKYVQSDMQDVFQKIGQLLSSGENVVFTGTSCQTHGLLNYLSYKKIDNNSLITLDLICHGVPSNLMHKEYINYYEKKKTKTPQIHYFRSKRQGWGSRAILRNYEQTLVHGSGNADYKSLESQLYANVFFSDFALRECCYNCPYCTENKPADITMADFWGIEETDIAGKLEQGCSLLIGRKKGLNVLNKLDGAACLSDAQKAVASKYQKHLSVPNDRPAIRYAFWKDYYQYGFDYVAHKYLHMNVKYKILILIYNFFNLFKDKRIASIIGSKIFY